MAGIQVGWANAWPSHGSQALPSAGSCDLLGPSLELGASSTGPWTRVRTRVVRLLSYPEEAHDWLAESGLFWVCGPSSRLYLPCEAACMQSDLIPSLWDSSGALGVSCRIL